MPLGGAALGGLGASRAATAANLRFSRAATSADFVALTSSTRTFAAENDNAATAAASAAASAEGSNFGGARLGGAAMA
eukprot:CAMPEP_0183397922 /NCGR_PEP_ID=MMETSP0370-20130417/10914_1 /TAXON_ID=268820 /ORGANISM="Peridinium aciculiferum, Strain PAER-2" /LENGTH=77 /DNA_ID=CAMNT_0025578871 /DNA_START=311 /DNA_END=540 /DNA_ORIENTATION=+